MWAKQQRRNELVLQRLINYSNEDEDNADVIADALEWMLDDLAGSDFFGTEMQWDPRGDKRAGDDYTMFDVQGVD